MSSTTTVEAPTGERGHAGATRYGPLGGTATGWRADDPEHVVALAWPNSVETYSRMLADAQVAAIFHAVTLGIVRAPWRLDPQDADPGVVAGVADDLGLPILGQRTAATPRRRRGRLTWDAHLRDAVATSLAYGHAVFEQVAPYDETARRHRLRKLAERLPRTIARWEIAADGMLDAVHQWPPRTARPASGPRAPRRTERLEISRLVVYSHDREGSAWWGRSALRPAYGPWWRKDRRLRVDLIAAERNGMGQPVAEFPAGTPPNVVAAGQAMAASVRAGERSGASIEGGRLRLIGVEGTLPDILAGVRYEDEQIARTLLGQWIGLGGADTGGSRALAQPMLDVFAGSLDAEAAWVADVATVHVVEDLVDWTHGPDAPAPAVVVAPSDESVTLTVDALNQLVTSGGLTVDEELESYIRDRFGLPARSTASVSLPPTPDPVRAARRPARADAGDVPVRARRQATGVEAAAQVDFAALEAQFVDARDRLLDEFATVRAGWVDDLTAQVRAATTLADLDGLTVATDALAAVVAAVMAQAAEDAAAEHVAEVGRQGVDTVEVEPDLTAVDLAGRAALVAGLLAAGAVASARGRALVAGSDPLDSDALADDVRSHLEGLSDVQARDRLGGAVTAATNAGRTAAMGALPEADYYASELLDSATCANCSSVDGTQFGSLAEVRAAYPAGGYHACLGGDRCRGTAVAVHGESEPGAQ